VYDELTTRYTFACPEQGETSVRLSAFRRLERLPGAAHPAVYSVSFACGCGGEHPGLVSHDELDWAPLGLGAETLFMNLMTARLETVDAELTDVAARRIQSGEWPWSFFCYPEDRPRPVFPSSFCLLAPTDERSAVGIAVRCPACTATSINLVSAEHVDLPFHNDGEIGVVEHVFEADAARALEDFAEELYSARFDARRLALD
jgi:antitoxin component of MazEF toxin-antitoxin module